ncbi:MAG: peptidylprolyl isomerase, partial [Butyricicoccus sp.]
MKKRTFLLFGLLAMLVLTACGGKSGAQTSTDDATDTSDNSQQTTAEEIAQPIGQHHAQITIKDHGTIDIELDGDAAPISVQNFMDLANDGFYDGLTFHRIITGFMMQG